MSGLEANLNADLPELIRQPREALDVEAKEWLDLSDNAHRATIAKEIIALANHGGGYLVIGVEERDSTLKAVPNPQRPTVDWSQDAIQSIVAKYIDPTIQCAVSLVDEGGTKFPVVRVPGGHRVPIRAKAGSPDGKRLVPNRIYIRRPGPYSEEPQTTEEWDRFFDRIVKNRQAELIDAMRSILNGVIPRSLEATDAVQSAGSTRRDELRTFELQAIERWTKRTTALPQGAAPKLPHGYYDVSFAIGGAFDKVSLRELADVVRDAVKNHSGWPPFVTLGRDPFRPVAVDGAVECWIGPDSDGSFDSPAHHDFWRVSPAGLMFLRRGYQEDGGIKGHAPGTTLDITTPTWRFGEAVLEAFYMAQKLNADADAELLCRAAWRQLSGRALVSVGNSNRILMRHPKATQDTYEVEVALTLGSIPAALPEFVWGVLAPLYELFEFWQLPKRLVEQELATLQSRTFSS